MNCQYNLFETKLGANQLYSTLLFFTAISIQDMSVESATPFVFVILSVLVSIAFTFLLLYSCAEQVKNALSVLSAFVNMLASILVSLCPWLASRLDFSVRHGKQFLSPCWLRGRDRLEKSWKTQLVPRKGKKHLC